MEIHVSDKEDRGSILKNLDKNMFVEAGAGAGKTTTIVNRIIEQLKSGRLVAEKLVAITFTNAAAEELRGRIMKRLHEESENPSLTQEERENLEAAIENESLIQISTIHSFCKRLLTEQTFAAKLPMDVQLLEDTDANVWKLAFFRQWFKEKMTPDRLSSLISETQQEQAGAYIKSLFLDICDLPMDHNIRYAASLLVPGSHKYDDYIAEIRKSVSDIFTETLNILRRDVKPFKDMDEVIKETAPYGNGTVGYLSKAAQTLYENYKNCTGNDLVQYYCACWQNKETVNEDGLKFFDGRNVKALPAHGKDTGKARNAELLGVVQKWTNWISMLEVYQASLFVQVAEEARLAYRDLIRKPENRHVITNDLLLQEALALVKNNSEARRFFQESFTCIYVDEFQDTDPVQCELIELLCEEIEQPDKRRMGSFFLVGDPKQSIYAFRGADVDVYNAVKTKYAPNQIVDVEEYALECNFRSEKPVVDWVNQNFEQPIEAMFSGGYTPMAAANDNPDEPGVLRGVYTLDHPNWCKAKGDPYQSSNFYDSKSTKKAQLTDSQCVAALVRHLTGDGLKIWDKKKEVNEEGKQVETWVKRPIEYRDILILCEKKDAINLYADVLKKAGIPVNLYGALELNEEELPLRFRQLYHYLAYPYDMQAVCGAREILMGAKLTAANELEADARAEMLKERTKSLSAYELLQYMAHHVEYILDAETTGEAVRRAQSRIQQILEALIVNPQESRQEVDRKLQMYMDSKVDRELIMDKGENAVRFMNLHKAKGLEGRIVILASRTSRSSHKSPYRDGLDYYPIAKIRDDGTGKGSMFSSELVPYSGMLDASGTKIADLAKNKTRQERIRQDYVAVTRAMEALIFMDALCDGCVYSEYDLTTDVKNLLHYTGVTQKPTLQEEIDAILSGASSTGTSTPQRIDYNMGAWDVSIEKTQSFHQSHSVTPSSMERQDAAWKPGPDADPRPTGNIFGTAMHRCFELLVNRIRSEQVPADASTEDKARLVQAVVMQTVLENYEDIVVGLESDEAEEQRKLYQTYLESVMNRFLADTAMMQAVRDAKEVYTELSFSQFATQEDAGNVDADVMDMLKQRFALDAEELYWLNGSADLVLVDADGNIRIVDYKSDHIGTETVDNLEQHLNTCYNNQQQMYRYALSVIFQVPVDRISFEYYHLYR